ncbi:NAD(+)--rifampin ADP-ribosyltransferase [Sulfitobacter porphyrae]|uniref:NAD(+)--rifampin ADP-ribosyltransferase n=1 Tax=Sulfitobacter porphyrae TaxID=1246864 RepID=A0ABW2B231_9RHOB|nr:rifampin ADP-ribosyl transferase [Sulfitobacter porphyrae]
MPHPPKVFTQAYLHGTRADLRPGDLISVGYGSNFREEALAWVYFTSTMDTAIWGAELARGDNPERIYVVEALGEIVDDPNLTDKKFPGNPSMSYRSRAPLRVVAEVVGWHGHSEEQVRQMKDGLAQLAAEGTNRIID